MGNTSLPERMGQSHMRSPPKATFQKVEKLPKLGEQRARIARGIGALFGKTRTVHPLRQAVKVLSAPGPVTPYRTCQKAMFINPTRAPSCVPKMTGSKCAAGRNTFRTPSTGHQTASKEPQTQVLDLLSNRMPSYGQLCALNLSNTYIVLK